MCMVMVCHPSYLECLKITLSANIVTMIFRDDVPFISQLKRWHIKGDKTKYISPKFFYTLELQQNKNIDIKQICFTNNFSNVY